MLKKLSHLIGLIKAIGLKDGCRVLLRRSLKIEKSISVRLRSLPGTPTVRLRPTESDLFVASQIAGWSEYDIGPDRIQALNRVANEWVRSGIAPIVIDGGANVGYSSLYFAETYPDATIIAVEADPATYEVLLENVRGYGQIVPANVALWSSSDGVNIEQGPHNSWSNRVVGARASETAVTIPSATMADLVATVESGRPLLIKLDIEGAEREACSASSKNVLREVPCIMVEPHDFKFPGANCLAPLLAAVGGRVLDTILLGENLVFLESSILKPVELTSES